MIICAGCGHVFGEPSYYTEVHGEEMACCPRCGGNEIGEAVQCDVCGEYYCESEMEYGVCDYCINEKRNDPEFCYNLSIGENTNVEINSFLASVLDKGDINQILWEYVKKNMPNLDCSPFIDEDKYWFADAMSCQKRKEVKR